MNRLWEKVSDVFVKIGYYFSLGVAAMAIISAVVFVIFVWVKYVMEPLFQWAGVA